MAVPGMDLSTASAWGVTYECEKLRRTTDIVIVDTPPKVDADLRPALREADLILIPVAASHVDLWAVEGVLDLAARERKRATIVLNRTQAGTRLDGEVARSAAALDAGLAGARLGHRVAFAATLGTGLGVQEAGRSAAGSEVQALADEVLALLQAEGPFTMRTQKA
jgi:chromosome partitioning protein